MPLSSQHGARVIVNFFTASKNLGVKKVSTTRPLYIVYYGSASWKLSLRYKIPSNFSMTHPYMRGTCHGNFLYEENYLDGPPYHTEKARAMAG